MLPKAPATYEALYRCIPVRVCMLITYYTAFWLFSHCAIVSQTLCVHGRGSHDLDSTASLTFVDLFIHLHTRCSNGDCSIHLVMGPKHSKKPAKPKLPALPAGGSQRSTRLTSARQQQIADKVAGSTRSRNLFDDSEDEIEDTDIAMVDDEDKERRKSNPTWKADNSPTDGKSTLPDPDDDEQPEQQAEWEYGIFGLQWTDEHLHNDPVFKSADAEAAYAAALGATAVQPAQHVEDNLFPNAAGFWGLQRWLPEPGKVYIKLHSGSRGPSCYLTARGNKATCHFQYYAIPFLYE